MNLQMVLANATLAVAVWAVACAMIFIAYGRFAFSAGIVLMCLNVMVFTIASLSIGLLAGKFVKDHMAQAALTNVISLGTSFICGVFVSQNLLGKTVLQIASFTPGYWYIKAVRDISVLENFSAGSLKPVVYSMLIQLGFAAVFILIALAASRQKHSRTAGCLSALWYGKKAVGRRRRAARAGLQTAYQGLLIAQQGQHGRRDARGVGRLAC